LAKGGKKLLNTVKKRGNSTYIAVEDRKILLNNNRTKTVKFMLNHRCGYKRWKKNAKQTGK